MIERTLMITGASRGIGAATAERFAKAGYDQVLICKNNRERMERLAERLHTEYGIHVQIFAGDVGEEAFAERVFAECPEVDILINNAGVSHVGLLSDMTMEAWDAMIRTNLTGVFLFSRYAIPAMVRKKEGQIINVSSVWGSVGASCETAYSATKGGVNALTKALAKELAPSNIQVNAIAPGCIDTDMNGNLTEEERDALCEEIPAGRFGTPEEAAELIFSVAHAPSYLTGQIIGLTGGWN